MPSLRSLLPCRHPSTTVPMRASETDGALAEKTRHTDGMYVACLECGQEIPYNWLAMRREPASAFQTSLRQLMSAVSEAAAESPFAHLVGYSSDSQSR